MISSKFIASRYGRKAGLVRHHFELARFRLGLFSSLMRVDWDSVNRLVFVCAGNICRSAYGEGRAKRLGLPAISFGLDVQGEFPANEMAIREASARGIDLSDHRTRSAEAVGLRNGDLLLAMEPEHVKELAARGIPVGVQTSLLGIWSRPPRPHLEDPYGLAPEYFTTCFGLIDNALSRIARLMPRRGQHDPS